MSQSPVLPPQVPLPGSSFPIELVSVDPVAGTPAPNTATGSPLNWFQFNILNGNLWSAVNGVWFQINAGGGGGGVSSFNSRTGAVVPATGDYSSLQLGDFAVTRVSDTQLSVAPGNAPPIPFNSTTAIVNIAAGVGSGTMAVYLSVTDSKIHVISFGLDATKISGTNIVVEVDLAGITSNWANRIIAEWDITSDVFASSGSDIRNLGLYPINGITGSHGIVVPVGGNFPGNVDVRIDPDGPAGLWQKWNVSVNLNRGQIATTAIAAGGSGYSVSDSITLENPSGTGYSDGSSDANFIVDTVDGTGVILTGHIDPPGIGYASGTTYQVSGGTGANALITVSTVTPAPGFLIANPDTSYSYVLMAAALTQDVVLCLLDSNVNVDVPPRIKSNIAAVGTTTLTATLGLAGANTFFLSTPYNLMAAVSPTNFAQGATGGNNTTDAINFVVGLTSTVDNLSSLTTGSWDIWVKFSLLP